MKAPFSLWSALEEDFPALATVGGPVQTARSRPRDEARFRRNLDAIARRLRHRSLAIMLALAAWFVMLIGIVIASKDPAKTAVALGASGAGTIWCFTALARMNRELTVIEILLEAAKDDQAVLGELVEVCRSILHGSLRRPGRRAATAAGARGRGTKR